MLSCAKWYRRYYKKYLLKEGLRFLKFITALLTVESFVLLRARQSNDTKFHCSGTIHAKVLHVLKTPSSGLFPCAILNLSHIIVGDKHTDHTIFGLELLVSH